MRESWEPIANRGRVDLWVSGHVHKHSRIHPARGKNAYTLIVGAPDMLTRVDVTRAQLKVIVTRESGETVDTVSIRAR